MGAGAVGGVVGARLHQAGHHVTLIAREGPHLEAIRDRGLRLESPTGPVTLAIPVVPGPAHVEWSDETAVLMAVKTQHTAQALGQLASIAPLGSPVVCLQNGTVNESMCLRIFPNVYAVSVNCPTSYLQPGVVQAWSTPVTGMLDIGRFPTGIDRTTMAVSDDFASATFSSRPDAAIRRWKNRKLITNLGNAIEAVCGPAARRGELGTIVAQEGEAVLGAAGLELASVQEDLDRRGDLLQLGLIGGEVRPGGSSWQSLRRGTGSIETDYLNGEIVLLGRIYGVPTPANELLQRLAREASAQGSGPGMLSPAEFLALLEARTELA